MKLYLIESTERQGLVKIGFAGGKRDETDSPVYPRVKSYATGISDSSVVHETSGAKVFEYYLHWLASGDQKTLIFVFWNNSINLKSGLKSHQIGSLH